MRQVSINVIAIWSQRIVNMLVPLFSIPLIAKTYGIEQLAIWLLVLQLSGHLGLLNLGLNNSLVRILAKPAFEGNKEELSKILSTTLIVLTGLGGLCLLFLFLLPHFPVDLDSNINSYMTISIIFIAIGMPFQVGYGMLAASKNFALIAIANIISQLAWLTLLALYAHYINVNLITLVFIYFLIFFIKDLVLLLLGSHKLRKPKINFSYFSRISLRSILSLSLAAIVLSASAITIRQGGSLWAGMFFDLKLVTIITLPLMVVFGVAPFINVLSQIIKPTASIKNNIQKLTELKSEVIISAKYSILLATLILVVFLNASDQLFNLWLGSTLPSNEIDLIIDYFFYVFYFYLIMAPSILFRSVLIAIGKHWQTTFYEATCNIIGFITGIFITFYFTFDATGVIFGVCLAFFMRAIGLNLHLIRMHFGITLFELLKKVYVFPLLIIIVHWCFSLASNNLPIPFQIIEAAKFISVLLLFIMSVEKVHLDKIARKSKK